MRTSVKVHWYFFNWSYSTLTWINRGRKFLGIGTTASSLNLARIKQWSVLSTDKLKCLFCYFKNVLFTQYFTEAMFAFFFLKSTYKRTVSDLKKKKKRNLFWDNCGSPEWNAA